jgi:GNAT superfamily N-acetyltransferase
MNPLIIIPVDSNSRHKEFCDVPYQLYRDDPLWVAPLIRDERRRWDPNHNASLKSRWHQRFIAKRGDQLVGRITAIVDPAFAEAWCKGCGMFGFFESEENPETALALLKTAEDAVQQQGCNRLVGPVNLTTHDETGLLVRGHESSPMFLSPYNPPYYENFLTDNGYQAISEYYAYSWLPQEYSPAITKLLQRAARQAPEDFHIRPANPKEWTSEIHKLHELYNKSFAPLWGFVPISWEEFEQRANQFRQFYREELCLFAEVQGKEIGFAILLPDVNEALTKVNGKLFPFGWWKLLRGIPKITGVRFILLGVDPEYEGNGVSVPMVQALIEKAIEVGMQKVELSLVHSQNRRVQRVIQGFGGKSEKTYRMFEKALDASTSSQT